MCLGRVSRQPARLGRGQQSIGNPALPNRMLLLHALLLCTACTARASRLGTEKGAAERTSVSIVITGHAPERTPFLCQQLAALRALPIVADVLIVWNNAPDRWWSRSPCARAFREPSTVRGGSGGHSDSMACTSSSSSGMSTACVSFHPEDRADNRYWVPGALNQSSSRSTLLLDDDVSMQSAASAQLVRTYPWVCESMCTCMGTWAHVHGCVGWTTSGRRPRNPDPTPSPTPTPIPTITLFATLIRWAAC